MTSNAKASILLILALLLPGALCAQGKPLVVTASAFKKCSAGACEFVLNGQSTWLSVAELAIPKWPGKCLAELSLNKQLDGRLTALFSQAKAIAIARKGSNPVAHRTKDANNVTAYQTKILVDGRDVGELLLWDSLAVRQTEIELFPENERPLYWCQRIFK